MMEDKKGVFFSEIITQYVEIHGMPLLILHKKIIDECI